jgi:hypothetical protein
MIILPKGFQTCSIMENVRKISHIILSLISGKIVRRSKGDNVSEHDHVIPPALERMFAKQMNATTISLPSSHASLVSHPTEIAQLILNATKGISK